MSHRRLNILELRSVRGTGGGPEKTILFGTALADRQKFAVTVCYLRDKRDPVFSIDQRADRLDIEYLEIRENHSFDYRIWRQLLDIVARQKTDIIHSHDYKTNVLALLAARKTGALPLSTVHGWTGNSTRERLVYYPADKRVLSRFPKVVAVSSDIRNELVKHGTEPRRVEVLLNGIDPSAFVRNASQGAAIRQEFGLDPRHTVIGAVGRVERQKRFDLLLEAFATVCDGRPDLRLMIVGDGSLREELIKQAAGLGVESSCVFTGHRNDIAALHSAFDLFVQSSEYEGTPNAVLEAMAMETPIVATSAGGTAELALPGEHATIIPTNDVPLLIRAMTEALDDAAGLRTRAAAARRRIETVLSFEARTRRLEAIYGEMWREAGRA
jgi:glycosyltransferase involved in cell wall biosynthesis